MDEFEKARQKFMRDHFCGIKMNEETMKEVRGINCTGYAWNYGNRDTVHSKG